MKEWPEGAFRKLCEVLGVSAATTYHWNRMHGIPAKQALCNARLQMLLLGKDYSGGLECVVFRKYHRLFN